MSNTHEVRFILGCRLQGDIQTKIATKLTDMLNVKSTQFKVIVDEHCTTFITDKKCRCGLERFVKLQSFMEGVRFSLIHGI